jgi:2-amino-4-hydroxy-6-hydroxymethyldihydropteridine diphosphokinase
MTRAAVALGSNLGDRRASLCSAADALTRLGTVVSISSLYETAPIGGPEQENFFNAVIVIDTDLEPRELLDELHRIEAEAGRVREVRWGPRRLDLDLILYGTRRAEDGGMVVPHPRFSERRFVLDPLVEAWPEAQTPEGRKVADLLPGVADQEVVSVGAWWPKHESPPGPQHQGSDSSRTGAEDRQIASTFATRGGWWVIAQGLIGGVVIMSVLLFADTIQTGRWLVWLGAFLFLAGLVQSTLGLLHLGVSLTPYPEPLDLGNLVFGGVYRSVRHPVYGGLTLGMVGLALYQLSWAGLGAAVGGGIFFWVKAGFEENRLLAKYPEYLEYRARTRARIIPWII